MSSIPFGLESVPVTSASGEYAPFFTLGLRGGRAALVSESDRGLVEGRPWAAKRQGQHDYVVACFREFKWDRQSLHRHLLGLLPGDPRCGDHINGDGFDNRRENLRICTIGENTQNRRRTRGRIGFKGVSICYSGYQAKIGNGSNYIGCFKGPVEAALAYNDEAILRFGQFANLNVVEKEAEFRALLAERDRLQGDAERINAILKDWPCA